MWKLNAPATAFGLAGHGSVALGAMSLHRGSMARRSVDVEAGEKFVAGKEESRGLVSLEPREQWSIGNLFKPLQLSCAYRRRNEFEEEGCRSLAIGEEP